MPLIYDLIPKEFKMLIRIAINEQIKIIVQAVHLLIAFSSFLN